LVWFIRLATEEKAFPCIVGRGLPVFAGLFIVRHTTRGGFPHSAVVGGLLEIELEEKMFALSLAEAERDY
jgi:hypothetical protein